MGVAHLLNGSFWHSHRLQHLAGPLRADSDFVRHRTRASA